MSSIDELVAFSRSDAFIKILTSSRPEVIQIRAVAGTKEGLEWLTTLGYGASVSEAARICLQVGLAAFKAQEENDNALGNIKEPKLHDLAGLEGDEPFPPDDAWASPK